MPDDAIVDGSGTAPVTVAPEGAGGGAAGQPAKTDAEWRKEVETINKRYDDLRAHLDSRIDKLVNAVQTPKAGDAEERAADKANAEQLKDYRKEIQEKYDAGQLTGEQFLNLIEGSFTQAEGRATKAAKAEADAIRKEMAALNAKLEDVDPDFVAVRDRVKELQAEYAKDGVPLDRKTAIAILKRQPAKQPARPPIPGGTGGGFRRGEDGEPATTDEQIAGLEALPFIGKLSDKEKAALKKGKA